MTDKDKRQVKTVELSPTTAPKTEPRLSSKDFEPGVNINKTVDGLTVPGFKHKSNKFLSVVKGMLTNNWQLKITAIVAGVIIWGLAIFL